MGIESYISRLISVIMDICHLDKLYKTTKQKYHINNYIHQ